MFSCPRLIQASGGGEDRLVNDGVADAPEAVDRRAIAPARQPLGGVLLRVEPDGAVSRAAAGLT